MLWLSNADLTHRLLLSPLSIQNTLTWDGSNNRRYGAKYVWLQAEGGPAGEVESLCLTREWVGSRDSFLVLWMKSGEDFAPALVSVPESLLTSYFLGFFSFSYQTESSSGLPTGRQ